MTINLDEIEKALGEITQEKCERDGLFVYALADDPSPRRDFPSMSNKFQASVQPCGIPISTEELEANAHLIANAPDWLRLLMERVRKLEADVMRIAVVLEAAKAVVEDGNYDIHFENRSAALIDSGLLLRLENAINAISVREST